MSVHQFELLPQPPERAHGGHAPWPYWPMILRTSTLARGGRRSATGASTRRHFSGERTGNVKKLHGVRLEWKQGDNGRPQMVEIPGSEFEMDADLVLLALGFLGPEREGPISDLGVELDERGNVVADESYMSTRAGRLRLRRPAPRPVAGGVGDLGRARMRARRRPLPDGPHRPAGEPAAVKQ